MMERAIMERAMKRKAITFVNKSSEPSPKIRKTCTEDYCNLPQLIDESRPYDLTENINEFMSVKCLNNMLNIYRHLPTEPNLKTDSTSESSDSESDSSDSESDSSSSSNSSYDSSSSSSSDTTSSKDDSTDSDSQEQNHLVTQNLPTYSSVVSSHDASSKSNKDDSSDTERGHHLVSQNLSWTVVTFDDPSSTSIKLRFSRRRK